MHTRIGINGFGRIGRIAARIVLDSPDLSLVAVNSPADSSSHAYLLQHDSVYGLYNKEVSAQGDALRMGKHTIACYHEKEPGSIPWDKTRVDIVLECSGKFKTRHDAQGHLQNGVKAVILSVPAKDDTPTYVMGVNHTNYNPKDTIVSNSSCTTNCVTTVLKVLDDAFGVVRGNMTTIHAVTDSQNLLDNSHKKNARLRRSAMLNLIPTSSGSAKDVAKLFPHLAGKLPCRAVRVPVPTVSIIDLVVELKKKVTPEIVNQAFFKASQGIMRGIVGYAADELVSTDSIGSPFSATFDPFLTDVVGDTLVHVAAWYDNEWGYGRQLVELARYIASTLGSKRV